MKAAYIESVGPPANIHYGDLPSPTVGPTDVLIHVAAVTVDPIDTYIRSGKYPEQLSFPFIIGRDLTGVVQQVGIEVKDFKPGDRVWCNNQGYAGRQGSFAELASVDQSLLYHLPENADLLDSVAVLHSALTAVVGLYHRPKGAAGETLFIQGGDGNVGTAVLQLAVAAGMRVAVTAGSAEKAAWCSELGAECVIQYKSEDITKALQKFAPDGVNIYWDATGTAQFEKILPVVARRGRIVLMSGITNSSNLQIGQFYTHNLTLYGFTVTDATVQELSGYAKEINQLLASGQLRGKIHATLLLSAAAEAHRMMEEEKLFGKIVLVP